MDNLGKKPFVLVIDDSVEGASLLKRYLELEGFNTRTAANGLEALDLIGEGQAPEVVFVDLVMPVMDGYEFLRRTGADPRLGRIPIYVFSASSPGVLPRPVEGVLEKPVDVDVLVERVRAHWQRQPSQTALAGVYSSL